MRCRICTKEISAKNRSLIKGICKLDFKYGSAAQVVRIDDGRYQGHVLHDTSPPPTEDLFASHIAALGAKPEYEWEADLSSEEVKILGRIRRKKITSIRHPMPYPEASLVPPKKEKRVVLEVELSEEEQELLERMRAIKKWEGRS